MCFRTVEVPYLLLVFNPLFPHDRKILTVTDMVDNRGTFYTGTTYDRKSKVCKLVLCFKTKQIEAFDCGMTSFVYYFQEGAWKKLREWNRMPRNYYC